jgi:hypothetical protein
MTQIAYRINEAIAAFIAKTDLSPNAVLLGEKEWAKFAELAEMACVIKDDTLKGKRSTIMGCVVFMVDAESHLSAAFISPPPA